MSTGIEILLPPGVEQSDINDAAFFNGGDALLVAYFPRQAMGGFYRKDMRTWQLYTNIDFEKFSQFSIKFMLDCGFMDEDWKLDQSASIQMPSTSVN